MSNHLSVSSLTTIVRPKTPQIICNVLKKKQFSHSKTKLKDKLRQNTKYHQNLNLKKEIKLEVFCKTINTEGNDLMKMQLK